MRGLITPRYCNRVIPPAIQFCREIENIATEHFLLTVKETVKRIYRLLVITNLSIAYSDYNVASVYQSYIIVVGELGLFFNHAFWSTNRASTNQGVGDLGINREHYYVLNLLRFKFITFLFLIKNKISKYLKSFYGNYQQMQ